MAGMVENLIVRATLKLEEKKRLKWCVGVNYFLTERLLSDYQATFPLCCGNYILTATVTK